ncbi:hypothetical protein [Mycolicibacterium llatzerense]|uniref:Uncharacterized protein n=1 Tax=Mycolicibacterium llatzerense TaxID=280871 RepID=A0A0D1JZ93_9MYCO|nr:hypothetical protein [Mycolicibacterium llatzerense]KIU17974.1 hypothetical protein TL10_04735 [Mycolicibacterium llatzerense]MCT7367148.1 hypothetical protein [Mycolicibacterium llatzerense]MCT7371723.1 hypothetical protein [Mycolicibacterium llatzerense]
MNEMAASAMATGPSTLAYVFATVSVVGTSLTTLLTYLWMRRRERPVFQTTIKIITPRGGQMELEIDPLASDEDVAQRVVQALHKSRSADNV